MNGDFNVLLISLDTLRADRLSLYGHDRPTSPNLEQLAREAIVFENFFNNGGFTLPSHMTLMTSMHPEVHGVHNEYENSLPETRMTLADVLQEAGFNTAAFVDAGWMRGKFGFGQGFRIYDDQGGRFKRIMPKALGWLRQHHEERFFLFVHSFDVHSQWGQWPYHCPGDYPELYTGDLVKSDFNGCKQGHCGTNMLRWVTKETQQGRNPLSNRDIEHMRAMYDGCINYVDAQVAVLLRELRDLGVYDRTLIVILSDHGEEFQEHGNVLHIEPSFYEELIHIPLIIKLPHSREGGKRVANLAAMVDVMPTILEVLDLEIPNEAQGHSLVPLITRDKPVRKAIRNTRAVRTQEWKYDPHDELLFNLREDPQEIHNRFTEMSSPPTATVTELHRQLRRLVQEDRRRRQALELIDPESESEVTLSEEEIQELEALGYL